MIWLCFFFVLIVLETFIFMQTEDMPLQKRLRHRMRHLRSRLKRCLKRGKASCVNLTASRLSLLSKIIKANEHFLEEKGTDINCSSAHLIIVVSAVVLFTAFLAVSNHVRDYIPLLTVIAFFTILGLLVAISYQTSRSCLCDIIRKHEKRHRRRCAQGDKSHCRYVNFLQEMLNDPSSAAFDCLSLARYKQPNGSTRTMLAPLNECIYHEMDRDSHPQHSHLFDRMDKMADLDST
jgi:hypothetical protein